MSTDVTDPCAVDSPDHAWARLTVAIDGVTESMKSAERRRLADRPTRGPVQRAGTVPTTGPLVLDLGQPAMGHRWNVRNLSVTNAAGVRTAAAGTVDVYVGNPAAYSPDAYRWNAGSMPATVGFSADRLEVIPSDHLFVVVEGGTAGDVLMARADVLDYPSGTGRVVMPL